MMTTIAGQLGEFAVKASYERISQAAREQLRIRVLDAVGCAVAALGGAPVGMARAYVTELQAAGPCTLIGGGRTAPDRAAFFNGTLVRYLDFNDSYLAKGETCHPSDNIAVLLSAGQYAGRSGRDFLTALAVAYQVQCRLSDVAPVRSAGFDHTTQGSYAVAAGLSHALGFDASTAANAIAICGTAYNALRVTRTGKLSHWKGLAYPNTAACCMRSALMAKHGITGPLEVFEGDKGFMNAIAGRFEIDWSKEDLERVCKTILKKYNAEVHSQTAIEGILQLQREYRVDPVDVVRIDVEVFNVAFHIIGGGEEGDKTAVINSKERADHSLPYILAVALLDRQVMPDQYLPERINREDVQDLLCRVHVRPDAGFSERFPKEMPCRIKLSLRSGQIFTKEIASYPGFTTSPMTWQMAYRKFDGLAAPFLSRELRDRIADAIANIERIQVSDLMHLLGTPCIRQQQ